MKSPANCNALSKCEDASEGRRRISKLASTRTGQLATWRTLANRMEANRKKRPIQPYGIATAYAHLGERQSALAWLEQAVEERDPWAVYMKVEPAFAALRPDPRFQQIVKTAGIP